MADDHSTPRTGPLRTAVSAGTRIAADLLIVTFWVVFLTLLFLETAWPRWAFYALLLGGVGVYVTLTRGWMRDADGR